MSQLAITDLLLDNNFMARIPYSWTHKRLWILTFHLCREPTLSRGYWLSSLGNLPSTLYTKQHYQVTCCGLWKGSFTDLQGLFAWSAAVNLAVITCDRMCLTYIATRSVHSSGDYSCATLLFQVGDAVCCPTGLDIAAESSIVTQKFE